MNPIDPESLIYRFCKQLELGSSMMQVASEAVRIVQRMNRDWMITGRRPAGICGAALILAARMNNFRRTVREVVYVVKVTELTIHQRLNEFKATESGELTVDQFRSVELESAQDPPAFRRAKEGANKRKAAEIEEDEEGEEQEEDNTNGEPDQRQTATPEPSMTRPRRVDADGFAIPAIPIDPALMADDRDQDSSTPAEPVEEEEDGQQDQRQTWPSGDSIDGVKVAKGRPKSRKTTTQGAPPPTEAELAAEAALEDEMTALLSSDSSLVAAERSAPDQKEPTPKPVSTAADIDPGEFDSDPEVQNCLLSPSEVEIKERMWVTENKEYLRIQQAKALKRALAEADSPGGGAGAAQDKRPRKRRKGRLGDVEYLNVEGPDGKTSRASTPAEATKMMLEKRGFSKKINYKLFEAMYEDDGEQPVKKRRESESDHEQHRAGSGSAGSGAGAGAGGIRSRSRSRSRSASVVSERGFGGGTLGGLSARSGRLTSAKRTGARAGGAPVPSPSPRASPVPPLPPSARRVEPEPAPAPAPAPEKTQAVEVEPAHPNEEIVGEIPESEQPQRPFRPEDYDGEEDEDEDEGDEDGEDDDDQVDAAFAGDYYDDGSDAGYDDDF